jgi:hypothetical protein
MAYILTFVLCAMGYLAFILSADPQLIPPGIKVGMGITFLCLALMICLGWYVLDKLCKCLQSDDTAGRDEIEL